MLRGGAEKGNTQHFLVSTPGLVSGMQACNFIYKVLGGEAIESSKNREVISGYPVVDALDGNSEIGAHVRRAVSVMAFH